MGNNSKSQFKPVANKELHAAMVELRKGSRTSPQDTDKNKTNRTRRAAKRTAIKESMDD